MIDDSIIFLLAKLYLHKNNYKKYDGQLLILLHDHKQKEQCYKNVWYVHMILKNLIIQHFYRGTL